MRIIQSLMILVVILLFFHLATALIWILKLLLALGFLSLAYERYQMNRIGAAIAYLVLALVFQPLVAIGFGRIIWIVLQVIVLLWLIALIFRKENKQDIF